MRTAPSRPAKRSVGGRKRADVPADRIAHRARLDTRSEAVGKCLQHFARQVGQTAVGEAGDRVLLVNDERPAGEPGGDPARARDEAAEADDDRRAAAAT